MQPSKHLQGTYIYWSEGARGAYINNGYQQIDKNYCNSNLCSQMF